MPRGIGAFLWSRGIYVYLNPSREHGQISIELIKYPSYHSGAMIDYSL